MTAPLAATLDHPHAAPPEPGAAIEVAPRVWWLRMPLPFALDHINLWLIEEASGWSLVDCGAGTEATRTLWERHADVTLRGKPIRRIVVTHYHPDHVGNAEWLSARFGCPVSMTHAEYMNAHAVAGQHSGFDADAHADFFRRHGMPDEHAAELRKRGNHYARLVPELPRSFDRLLDGDRVQLGGATWRVLEGHGHSPEHAALYASDHQALISGDMLLPRISTNVSVWPSEPDGDPLRRFLDSLAVYESLPVETLVLPSHGLPFRGIALRVAQLRTHHAARLEELAAAIAAAGPDGTTAADLLPVLFRRELDLQQRFFAMGEAIAHLNYLWHAGRLDRSVAADGAIRFARSSRH